MDNESDRLHHNAFLALRGVFPVVEGEEAIAALLRSPVPVDPLFRQILADAIAPRGGQTSNVRLKLTGLDEGRFARAMRTRLKSLARGEDVIARIRAGVAHRDAVPAAADAFRLDAASIEKDLTYANRYFDWCAKFSGPGEPVNTNASYHAWCIDFHVASIKRLPPEEWVSRRSQMREVS